MVPSPFWIRLCVRGLKTHVSSTSNGRQSPYYKPSTRHRWQLEAALHDTILAFFSDCERGRRAHVDWLCSGDPSASQWSRLPPASSGNGCKPAASDQGVQRGVRRQRRPRRRLSPRRRHCRQWLCCRRSLRRLTCVRRRSCRRRHNRCCHYHGQYRLLASV